MIKFNLDGSKNHYSPKQATINLMKTFFQHRQLIVKCSLLLLAQLGFNTSSAQNIHYYDIDTNENVSGDYNQTPSWDDYYSSDNNLFSEVDDQENWNFQPSNDFGENDFSNFYSDDLSEKNYPYTDVPVSSKDNYSNVSPAPSTSKDAINAQTRSPQTTEINWNPSYKNEFKENDPGKPVSYSFQTEKTQTTLPAKVSQEMTKPTNKETAQVDLSELATKPNSTPTDTIVVPPILEKPSTSIGAGTTGILSIVEAGQTINSADTGNTNNADEQSLANLSTATSDSVGPINFNNVSMIEYIRFISRVTNKNFIFEEEDLQFNVTIISEKPTSVFNLMTALLQELRVRDLSLMEQGNSIIIHRNPRVRAPGAIVTAANSASRQETQIITRVFRLNTLDPLKVTEIIKPLLSDDALVEVLRDSNNLIITDLVANVDKIAQLIDSLDAPNSGVTVGQYVVRNGFVDSIVDLASKIILPIAQGNPFVLVPHASSNSVYIVSNPFIVNKALAILQNLDNNDGKTKVFSLDNFNQENGLASGKLNPQIFDPGTNRYVSNEKFPPQAYDVNGKYLPQIYDPNTDKYYPQFYDANNNTSYPLIYDEVTKSYYPNSYDNETGTFTPLIYDANLNSYRVNPTKNPNTVKGNYRALQLFDPNTAQYASRPYDARTGGFTSAAGSISDSRENRPIEQIPVRPEEFYPGSIGFGPTVLNEMSEFLPGGISAASRLVKDLPAGHIARTVFFIYKLKYRRGDQIETSIRKIALSLMSTGLSNIDLVSAINSVQWIESSNSLIFTGTVHALEKIKDLILEIDTPLNQVYIEMLILDTTLEDSLTYGVDWGLLFGGGNTAGGESFNPGDGNQAFNTLSPNVNSIPNAKPLLSGQGFNLGIIGKHLTHHGMHFSTISALVKALHRSDKAHILLNPRILTEDNVTAEIFVGETDRYKTQSISNDQGNVITNNFQFIDVGTTLRVTPLIGNNGIITLDIIEEVTSPAPSANSSSDLVSRTDVNLVPVLFKNRSTTRIHVPDGFFVVMSGLIDNRDSSFKNEIPCLGMIPILGGAGKFKRKNDRKRNLMIFIRPVIVNTECELEEITKRQQDVFRDKGRAVRAWNYEIDEALDFFNLKSTDPDEMGCQLK